MIRLKDKYNQVVVGEDYRSPLATNISNVYIHEGKTKGKATLNGEVYPVTLKFTDVWVLDNGVSINNIYQGVVNERKAM